MLKTSRFPILYVVEFLLWLPLLAGFAITASFLAAKPIGSLDLQGKSLPSSWEAAVANHGKFFEGFLISSHPLAFGLGLALLAVSAAILYPIHKAQALQRQAAGASHKTAHNIAHFLVAAFVIAIAYLAFAQILVSVAPT